MEIPNFLKDWKVKAGLGVAAAGVAAACSGGQEAPKSVNITPSTTPTVRPSNLPEATVTIAPTESSAPSAIDLILNTQFPKPIEIKDIQADIKAIHTQAPNTYTALIQAQVPGSLSMCGNHDEGACKTAFTTSYDYYLRALKTTGPDSALLKLVTDTWGLTQSSLTPTQVQELRGQYEAQYGTQPAVQSTAP